MKSFSTHHCCQCLFSSRGGHTNAHLPVSSWCGVWSWSTLTCIPWVGRGEVQDLRRGVHNGQKMSCSTPFFPSSHCASLLLASCLVDSIHGEAIKATSNSRLPSPEIRGCLLQVVVTKAPGMILINLVRVKCPFLK